MRHDPNQWAVRRELLWTMMFCVAAWWLNGAVFGAGWITDRMLDFSHYLNPAWLTADLGESLIYLHAQPPLMNIMIGVVFKLMPEQYKFALATIYGVLGLASMVCVHATLVLLGVRAWVRGVVMVLFFASPTYYMMSSWLASTHVEGCVFIFALHRLVRFVINRSARDMVWMCGWFALLGLTRGQWHLLVSLMLLVALVLLCGRHYLKMAVLCSLMVLVPLGGWYGKNALVFGFFGPSSWLGANVAQVVNMGLGRERIREEKRAGTIAPDYPADFIKSRVLARFPQDHPLLAGLPVTLATAEKTDDPAFAGQLRARVPHAGPDFYAYFNLNYLGMLLSARQDMQDSLVLIKRYPEAYMMQVLHSVWRSTAIPTFMHHSLNMVVVWPEYTPHPPGAGWMARTLYLFIPLAVTLAALVGKNRPFRHASLLLALLALTLTLVGCALNGAEHERMRWGWQAIYVVYAALALEMVCRRQRSNLIRADG